MKSVLFAVVALSLVSTSASAAAPAPQNACDLAAVKAARKFAHQNRIPGHDFQISSYDQDKNGNSLVLIQLPNPGTNGDCWTNLVVTVQEHADDSCDAIRVEEDDSAESCS